MSEELINEISKIEQSIKGLWSLVNGASTVLSIQEPPFPSGKGIVIIDNNTDFDNPRRYEYDITVTVKNEIFFNIIETLINYRFASRLFIIDENSIRLVVPYPAVPNVLVMDLRRIE